MASAGARFPILVAPITAMQPSTVNNNEVEGTHASLWRYVLFILEGSLTRCEKAYQSQKLGRKNMSRLDPLLGNRASTVDPTCLYKF